MFLFLTFFTQFYSYWPQTIPLNDEVSFPQWAIVNRKFLQNAVINEFKAKFPSAITWDSQTFDVVQAQAIANQSALFI